MKGNSEHRIRIDAVNCRLLLSIPFLHKHWMDEHCPTYIFVTSNLCEQIRHDSRD